MALTTPEPSVEAGSPDVGVADPDPAPGSPPALVWVGVSAGYILLAVALWWHVWSTHPSGVAPCGCSDPALITWFLAWPAHALAHGASPFFSSAMFHPTGINLLANTSSLAIGVPLAPVTWLFGPVATLNVAATLAPALSALAMYWLLRRWVGWAPAAFAGGLLYGFSPFVVVNVAGSHLMMAALVTPPLIVGCLDELFVRQRRRPVGVGVLLGLLVVLQFFLSTELLAIMAIGGVGAVTLLVAYALGRDRRDVARRSRHAVRGLIVAVVIAVGCLAYPAWFAVAGPSHLSGQLAALPAGLAGTNPHDVVVASYSGRSLARFGGYEGPPLVAGEYLGPGVLLVIALGTAIWFRDRRLWFFNLSGLGAFVLSLGVKPTWHVWLPWNETVRVPVVDDIIPSRFMALTLLCATVSVAVVVDHVYRSLRGTGRRQPGDTVRHQPGDTFRRHRGGLRRAWAAGATGLAVAGVAAVPIARALSGALPLTAVPVVVPAWFHSAPPHYSPRTVVLAYPFPLGISAPVLVWQAMDGMGFAIAAGGGPQSSPARAGPEGAGFSVLATAVLPVAPADASATHVRAVRRALVGWGVTTVVIPEPRSLRASERSGGSAAAVALLTATLGRPGTVEDGSLVWSHVQWPATSLVVSPSGFDRCVGRGANSAASLLAVSRCVMATEPRRG